MQLDFPARNVKAKQPWTEKASTGQCVAQEDKVVMIGIVTALK